MSTTTRILITQTVRYRGGTMLERGTRLEATSDGDRGWTVAHPRVEGAFAHVPAHHARVIAEPTLEELVAEATPAAGRRLEELVAETGASPAEALERVNFELDHNLVSGR